MRRFLPFFFIFAQLVLVSSAQKCVQNTDKLINGMCYRLVSQQLTYSDARDWCHSHNSFLAYVPQKTTATFLATYARASFDGQFNFWIGLNRRNSSSPFKWDAGYPVVFTNFQQITSQNCVVESVTNTLWSTYECDSELDFICSYEPGTTTPLETTTSAATVSEASTEVSTEASTEVSTSTQGSTKASSPLTTTGPESPVHFLFAYSNDLSARVVSYITLNILTQFTWVPKLRKVTRYANVRLDVRTDEPIAYHDDFQSFNASIEANLPNRTLSYPDASFNSSAIQYISKFLDSNPPCGSVIVLLMKRRLSVNTALDNLIDRLGKANVFVYAVMSTTPSGGASFEPISSIAADSYGMAYFTDDNSFYRIVNNILTAMTYYRFFAKNPLVTLEGRLGLGDVYLTGDRIIVDVTVQDHALTDDFNYLYVFFTSANDQFSFNITDPTILDGNYVGFTTAGDQGWFEVAMEYSYAHSAQSLEIRMYSYSASNFSHQFFSCQI